VIILHYIHGRVEEGGISFTNAIKDVIELLIKRFHRTLTAMKILEKPSRINTQALE
jgi:hypothetical protein